MATYNCKFIGYDRTKVQRNGVAGVDITLLIEVAEVGKQAALSFDHRPTIAEVRAAISAFIAEQEVPPANVAIGTTFQVVV